MGKLSEGLSPSHTAREWQRLKFGPRQSQAVALNFYMSASQSEVQNGAGLQIAISSQPSTEIESKCLDV